MRYGHFDEECNEYVIEHPDVPVSWTNYLGVKDLCTVISHNAGGYSFYKTAEHHRITRFRQNGVPLDRPGHYVYLRDDETGEYWSVSWQPVGKDLSKAKYQCRHGLSYSKFLCEYQGIKAEQLLFIPLEDDVELWDVKIQNVSGRSRQLSVFAYVEFSFHHIEIDNQNLQMSLYASGSSYEDGIIEYDFFYEPWTYHYFAANVIPDSYECVRDRFLGPYRTETNPLSVEQGRCLNGTELGGNHCGALHKKLTIPAGGSTRMIFLLGVGPRLRGKEMRTKYSDVPNPRCSVRSPGRVLAEEARCVPVLHPTSRDGHNDQHMDPFPGRNMRRVVSVCVIHRSWRANRARVPGHISRRYGSGPHQPGKMPRADHRIAARAGELRLRSPFVRP